MDGVPLTSPSRTLLDLAAVLGASELPRRPPCRRDGAICSTSPVRRPWRASPGRRGRRLLLELLAAYRPPPADPLEAAGPLHRPRRRCRASAPGRGRRRRGDSRSTASGRPRPWSSSWTAGIPPRPRRLERDRRRDVRLQLAGYVVLRFTWDRLTNERVRVLATALATAKRTPPIGCGASMRTNAVLTEGVETRASEETLREVVEALAPLERLAGSDDERRGAEWIAARLTAAGRRAPASTRRSSSTASRRCSPR